MDSRLLETSLHPLRQSRFLRHPEVKLLVCRSFRLHKHHLSDFVEVAFSMLRLLKKNFYGLSTPWNIVSPTSPKSFFRCPEDRLWILRAIRLLKILHKRLRPSRFSRNSECRKWVGMAFRHLQKSLHRQPKLFFKTSRRQIMCSQCHSPT
jgi:hypothetical protein